MASEKTKKHSFFRKKNEKRLEKGEILRISAKKVGECYNITFCADGCINAIVSILSDILEKNFDMICIPKQQAMMGIGICITEVSDDSGETNEASRNNEEKLTEQILDEVNDGE